jgi:predicted phosphate transport protein (TIGR00153 family)
MPFGSLLPKEYSFFDFFEQHASQCVEGARLLLQMLRDVQKAETLAKEIKEVEHAGDRITHHTLETLHKTFITPIDRDEIHRLISGLDDILDFTEAVSERVALYEIAEVTPEAQALGEVLLHATEQVQEAVRGLRRLQYPMEMLQICVEIHRLENEGDALLRKAMARLFKERSSDPIYVIKWKELYELLEVATDACEDVANIIEGVVLEHA